MRGRLPRLRASLSRLSVKGGEPGEKSDTSLAFYFAMQEREASAEDFIDGRAGLPGEPPGRGGFFLLVEEAGDRFSRHGGNRAGVGGSGLVAVLLDKCGELVWRGRGPDQATIQTGECLIR